MEKNIKDYLPLYMGCKVREVVALGYTDYVLDQHTLPLLIHGIENDGHKVFLILLPLSEILSIPIEQKRQLLDAGLMYSHKGDEYTIWTPEATRLACSFGVDIFGLIESGLAIDATKEAVK